jgi:hypothetical protein
MSAGQAPRASPRLTCDSTAAGQLSLNRHRILSYEERYKILADQARLQADSTKTAEELLARAPRLGLREVRSLRIGPQPGVPRCGSRHTRPVVDYKDDWARVSLTHRRTWWR